MNPRRDYFDSIAAGWDSLPAPPDAADRAARFVAAAVDLTEGRILDAGCGTGILVDAMPRVRVTEMDISTAMLAENRRKRSRNGIEWICADALQPPFGAVFDRVLCYGVLPHLGDPHRALAALLACVRPGGAIAVGHMMSSDELNALHSGMTGPVAADHAEPAGEIARVLASLGARVVAAEERPGWYFVRAEK
jgi:2-polyprenyl-3-methyl-5-hydroxy-6-metoxy-1,4-benzoquinol methylase